MKRRHEYPYAVWGMALILGSLITVAIAVVGGVWMAGFFSGLAALAALTGWCLAVNLLWTSVGTRWLTQRRDFWQSLHEAQAVFADPSRATVVTTEVNVKDIAKFKAAMERMSAEFKANPEKFR